jgi:Putative Ig domain
LRLVVRQRLAIATRLLPSVAAGHPYRARLPVRGGVGPLRWSATLPRGLAIDARRGTISGTARSAGTFRVTVRVRDVLGAVSTRALVLSVR